MKYYVSRWYCLAMTLLPGSLLLWVTVSIYQGREFTITSIVSYAVFFLIFSYLVYKQSITPIIETSEDGIIVNKRKIAWGSIIKVENSHFLGCRVFVEKQKNVQLPVELLKKSDKESLLKKIHRYNQNST